MAVSPYITRMRSHIGTGLLLLPSVSAVVCDPAGRILLLRRSDNGDWSLPAGMVDPGEQPADAVLREIFEETAVHAEIDRVAGVASHPVVYPNGDRCEYLNVWFRCRAVKGEPCVNDDEAIDVGWLDPDRLPPLNDWTMLRIETSRDPDLPTWYPKPDVRYPALMQPDAI
mgnify:CR=1 FL=1